MPLKQKTIAENHGVTLDVIKKMSAAGVDVQDDESVKCHIKNTRLRVKPGASIPKDDARKTRVVSLTDYKEKLAKEGITFDEIKTIKEAGLAHKALTAAQKEEGMVVSIREVEERETKIGAATKAAFDKMGNELPGKCSGLDEVGILEVYEKLKREILTMLADLNSEFWKERQL